MSHQSPNLKPGVLVAARYRIDERIGEGGMGFVYRATQLGLDRAVAIKVIRPEYAQSPAFRQRFEREARVMAALDHEGKVDVIDFGVHTHDDGKDDLFLVMELLIGTPLSHHLTRGPLLLREAVHIGRRVADVLRTAHELRLVHRDLKPENLFVTPGAGDDLVSATIKVGVFGLAFIEDAGDMGRLTRDNVVTGTPAYVSPEQALARPFGPAADLYALGVILFEMVTGSPPFYGSPSELLAKHIYSPPPSLSRVVGRPMDLRIEHLVASLLKKDPSERPSIDDVITALDDLADHEEQSRVRPGRIAGNAALLTAHVDSKILWTAVELDDDIRMALAIAGVTVTNERRRADVVLVPLTQAKTITTDVPMLVGVRDDEDVSDAVNANAADIVALPIDAERLVDSVVRSVVRIVVKGEAAS